MLSKRLFVMFILDAMNSQIQNLLEKSENLNWLFKDSFQLM